jgi:sigma-E factor negative regulatory protein RseB
VIARTARTAALVLAMVLATVLPAWPQGSGGVPSAQAVVQAVLDAPSLIDYEGTKVMSAVRGDRAQTVTVLESYKRPGKLRLEFLSPESVGARLIVDDGVTAWQYEPTLHIVIQGPSFVGARDGETLRAVMDRYEPRVLGTEEVIGRETLVLSLRPRGGTTSRRLWVDRATGVLLRTEERDGSGDLVFSSFFTRISYSLNLPSALFRFQPPAGARAFSFYLSGDPVTNRADFRRLAGFPVIAPPALAGGYRFLHGTTAEYGAFSAAMATYGDGVSALSVFQTPSGRMAFPQAGVSVVLPGGGTGRLLDLGYFRILMWEARGLRLAAVGVLPPASLIALAGELTR